MHDVTRIEISEGCGVWHHEVPRSWREIAWGRNGYIKSVIFEKPTNELTNADKSALVAKFKTNK